MWPGMMPILHHVKDGNPFRDAHGQPDTGIRRFQDGVRGERGWHVDHGRVGAGLGDSLADRIEHGQPEVSGAALARRHAAHHPCAVGDRLFRMERALGPGESLADDPGLAVHENRHQR